MEGKITPIWEPLVYPQTLLPSRGWGHHGEVKEGQINGGNTGAADVRENFARVWGAGTEPLPWRLWMWNRHLWGPQTGSQHCPRSGISSFPSLSNYTFTKEMFNLPITVSSRTQPARDQMYSVCRRRGLSQTSAPSAREETLFMASARAMSRRWV